MTLPAPAADRTAVVTGASSGIGAEIARQLASRGHGVTLVARSQSKLEELASELGKGVRANVLTADLSKADDRATLLDRVAALGLSVDILVNNAGLSTVGPVARSDPLAEVNMIEVDVVAVAELCSRALAGMVGRRRGAILNVASTAAFQPLPGQAAYAAGKAFVLSYTEALRGELRGSGVTATALCPGPVATAFGQTAGFTQEEEQAALPRLMWVSAAEVAKVGVEALDRGQAVAIPGTANRLAAVMAHLTPNTLVVPILARQHPALRRP
ncbi:MAG TPA: SDR family oxidoreductase [Acidimicrobiales bacterium]|nr:SDR family oxidoreductase [Acidimicrobiales bacterium]